MGNFLVRYACRVVINDRRAVIRFSSLMLDPFDFSEKCSFHLTLLMITVITQIISALEACFDR